MILHGTVSRPLENRVDRVKEILAHFQSHLNIPKLSLRTIRWVVEVT